MALTLRPLILMLMLAMTAGWQSPALAGRLATVSGTAEGQSVTQAQEFRLAEQTRISVGYVVQSKGEGCSTQVRIYRQLPNGNWAVVNTPLRASDSARGDRVLALPAGDYRIEVVARNAEFTVTVDK